MPAPLVTPIGENFHVAGFLVSEDWPGKRSRQQITVTAQKIFAGTVLGQKTVGASAVAAVIGTNTGNGTFGAITVVAPAVSGAYTVEFDDATHYVVANPSGIEIGHGTTGVAFSAGGIGFTITAGGTAFVPGDSFSVTVAAGNLKWIAFDPTAADGSQVAAGILWGGHHDFIDATVSDQQATAIVRSAEVNTNELVWGANVTTTPQKTAALATLLALGVVAR